MLAHILPMDRTRNSIAFLQKQWLIHLRRDKSLGYRWWVRGDALPRLTPVAEKNLWKNIYLSYLTFSNPQEELWRLGAEAMLVDRLVGKINPAGKRMNSSQEHDRRHLTMIVIRHRQWAFNIAEHAAVDDFPCKEQFGAVQGGFDFFDTIHAEQLFAAGAEEFAHARAQVIKCSGSAHKVSVKPTLDHQGLLF
jgi:hypothetical protein